MFKAKNVCGAGLAACSMLMMAAPSEAGLIPSFQGLGDLGGTFFNSEALDISADGTVVVGVSSSAVAPGGEAFRWTIGGGLVGLGDLAGGSLQSAARGVSANGSVVVGGGDAAGANEAFRWTSVGGMVGIGDLPGVFSAVGQKAFPQMGLWSLVKVMVRQALVKHFVGPAEAECWA